MAAKVENNVEQDTKRPRLEKGGEFAVDVSAVGFPAASSGSGDPASSTSYKDIEDEKMMMMDDEELDIDIPQANAEEKPARVDDGNDEDEQAIKFRQTEFQPADREMNNFEYKVHTGVGICEVFSVPRVTKRAKERGLREGWAMDIAVDESGTRRSWDFSLENDQKEAMRWIRRDRPEVLVVSPPCAAFSVLRCFDKNPDEKKIEKAKQLVRFAIKLCWMQQAAGRKYIFEHPTSASSWRMP